MDAELQALKDAAHKLEDVTKTSRAAVEAQVEELKTKRDALHKTIDETFDKLTAQALADVIPTNVKKA